jgi:hypothetical protein
VELVDTRDLKSLARSGMRVRSPPVLPSKKYNRDYEELKKLLTVDNIEVFVYNHKGQIINIKERWS